MKKITKLIIFVMLVIPSIAESSVAGYWKSVDEQTNETSAYWKLEVIDDNLFGYLVNYPGMEPGHVCTSCKGKLKEFFEKPIKGTAWINLSQNDKGVWRDGYIINSSPDVGKKYKAEIWLENGNLKMRGYVGFIYRTQTWLRVDKEEAENVTMND